MVIMAYSLLWVLQDLDHQPYQSLNRKPKKPRALNPEPFLDPKEPTSLSHIYLSIYLSICLSIYLSIYIYIYIYIYTYIEILIRSLKQGRLLGSSG